MVAQGCTEQQSAHPCIKEGQAQTAVRSMHRFLKPLRPHPAACIPIVILLTLLVIQMLAGPRGRAEPAGFAPPTPTPSVGPSGQTGPFTYVAVNPPVPQQSPT